MAASTTRVSRPAKVPLTFTRAQLDSFNTTRLVGEMARNGLSGSKSDAQMRRELREMLELIDDAFESEGKRRLAHTDLMAANHDRLLRLMKLAERDFVKDDWQMRNELEARYERSGAGGGASNSDAR